MSMYIYSTVLPNCTYVYTFRLSLYDSAFHTAQEIAEKIQECNRYRRNGESTAKVMYTSETTFGLCLMFLHYLEEQIKMSFLSKSAVY